MSKLSHSSEEHMDEIELKRACKELGFDHVHDPNNLTVEQLSVCRGCGERVFVKNIALHECREGEHGKVW